MDVLYQNGRIIDGQGSELSAHGVLLAGEKIERVAPLAEFDGFSGQQVDLNGATMLPGLIDCHVHLVFGAEPSPGDTVDGLGPGEVTIRALANAQRTLLGGVTAVRDCGGQNYLEFAVRDACNRGDFLGPTIRAAGRMICMTGGHGNRAGRVADGVDEVVKAVREQIHAGSDLIKIMATGGVMTPGVDPEDAHYSPEELAAGIAEGHRFHKTCASHAQGSEGIINAVRAGVDSVEHGIFMTEHCIEAMLERGTFLVPTLSALINITAGADKGVPDYALEKARRVAARHRESIRSYYDAGGRIAMGTDAGTPFNLHGQNAQELAHMVAIGISPMDAITCSTSNGAALMRLEDHGQIRDGGVADLLVVEGNPLEDIGAVADVRNHRLVIKRGGVAYSGEAPTNASQRAPVAAAL